MKLKVQMISLSDVEERISDPNSYIFDVSSFESHLRHRIPGAVFLEVPFSARALPEDLNAALVFYSRDAKCPRARLAAHQAIRFGYRQVFVMKAGINGYLFSNKVVDSGTAGGDKKRRKRNLVTG